MVDFYLGIDWFINYIDWFIDYIDNYLKMFDNYDVNIYINYLCII